MDKKLRNIIIYITVAVMVVLGVAFLMTKNSSESYTTSQLVNLFKEDKVQSYTVNYGTGAIEITLKEGVKLKPAKDIATALFRIQRMIISQLQILTEKMPRARQKMLL